MFPTAIALNPGAKTGRAFWLPTKLDTAGVWRMFYGDGQWRRAGDSLWLKFSNGFTIVRLRGAGPDSNLALQALWASDAVGSDPPPSTASGRVEACALVLQAT
jgi:hypothetical protein